MPLIEVCVNSVESAIASQAGGADRVELCDNLFEGGTTPSTGSIALARERLRIKLHVIIRPRGGDFLYSDLEFAIMQRDIQAAKELGADGVVIGLLTADGDIDVPRTRKLVELARPMSVTFHRAFDVARNPFEALESLIGLGVNRVLTSGQEESVAVGAEMIAELIQRAGDRLIVMPGAGFNERNVGRIVARTGAREIHVTGFADVDSGMRFRNERVFMGGTLRPPEYSREVTNADIIQRLRQNCR
ncbi:MAG: copper homeostasis protein CutC [Planctomycetaceae bacterium]